MCQFVNHMEVIQLPVYSPSEKELTDPKLYANNVRAQMALEVISNFLSLCSFCWQNFSFRQACLCLSHRCLLVQGQARMNCSLFSQVAAWIEDTTWLESWPTSWMSLPSGCECLYMVYPKSLLRAYQILTLYCVCWPADPVSGQGNLTMSDIGLYEKRIFHSALLRTRFPIAPAPEGKAHLTFTQFLVTL
jgi:hypothetical protein